jgi:CheY-like chemotaxis protein
MVLLVEDSAADAKLMGIAFAEALPTADLRVVSNGEAALTALLEAGVRLPDLVLLDLNLPRLAGHEVLTAVRAAELEAVRRIPVVVMTTSSSPDEVERSYELGANSHIVKPQSVDALLELVASLGRYWFETVALPARS